MQQLIEDELRASTPSRGDVPHVERAATLIKQGQVVEALEELALALTVTPTGRTAEAALELLLGGLLQKQGGDVLRARLFGT